MKKKKSKSKEGYTPSKLETIIGYLFIPWFFGSVGAIGLIDNGYVKTIIFGHMIAFAGVYMIFNKEMYSGLLFSSIGAVLTIIPAIMIIMERKAIDINWSVVLSGLFFIGWFILFGIMIYRVYKSKKRF